MPRARQNFSHRLCRIHPLVLLLELWRELLHKAAVEVVRSSQCLLVAGILLTYQSTEACLRNKFSFYLSTDSVSTSCVECRFFFTPTLLIQFPALNLIDTSYFDSHSWSLLTTMISLIKKKTPHSIFYLFKRKKLISSVMGRVKPPISIYTASKKELKLLMPIREIGLS